MIRSIFVCAKDVMLIEACSEATANRRIRVIKDCLSKKEHQKITVREFCEYEGITIEEFNAKTVILINR